MFHGLFGKSSRYPILLWVAGLACLSTVAGFFGNMWWPLELLSHLRAQYFLILTIISFILFLSKRVEKAVFFAFFALVNLHVILPLYYRPPAIQAPANATQLRVLLSNVHESEEAFRRIEKLVQLYQPDLILLSEVRPDWIEAMHRLQPDYPFAQLEPRYAGAGIALYSQLPFERVDVWNIVPVDRPAIMVQVEAHGQLLTVIGLHPHPPLGDNLLILRNQKLTEVSRFVASQTGPVVVLGDLNITPWSPFFQDFLQTSGLHDGRRGFGLKPTWPVRWPPLWLPLDHFLASADIIVHDFVVGPDIGSDHFPVIVDFSLSID